MSPQICKIQLSRYQAKQLLIFSVLGYFVFSGIYVCSECGHELFSSRQKFEHNSPWPAFTETIREDSVSKFPESSTALKVLLVFFLLALFGSRYFFLLQTTQVVRGNVIFSPAFVCSQEGGTLVQVILSRGGGVGRSGGYLGPRHLVQVTLQRQPHHADWFWSDMIRTGAW